MNKIQEFIKAKKEYVSNIKNLHIYLTLLPFVVFVPIASLVSIYQKDVCEVWSICQYNEIVSNQRDLAEEIKIKDSEISNIILQYEAKVLEYNSTKREYNKIKQRAENMLDLEKNYINLFTMEK